ncbi:hypothetical protein EBI01_09530 [Marinomonas rhizomae]|uniref:Beta-glucosidase-like glycosyl hydrolase n=1 Tax=Marinomonas rhizomae TaxID=491948 RepID=A0A366JAA1_9GAMM|nr:glycoside hydrolase family 3 N-terminal domain-containing protein [Marinomonas rhizomae]RBP83882.1 beta-glucosidase-like glycosyl hydrolase [Marinomonas rhizomae]RNF73414.1 hypothetical protein EBI01_09530 [Marinomonas rhizomae]
MDDFLRTITFCILQLIISTFSFATTTPLADKYISEHGLKKSVGQIFVVGIPTDYKNTAGSSDYKKLIEDLNIGGIILNTYNLPSSELENEKRNTAVMDAANFVQRLKSSTEFKESPLMVMSDFESYRFTSVKYPLFPPPNPLVLSSTGDTKWSRYAARLAAAQLKSLGVNILLGPVFDLDGSKQDKIDQMTYMRSFSSEAHIALPHIKEFLEGLKNSKIISFSKHFPSYSSTFSDTHEEPSNYIGSHDSLIKEIEYLKSLDAYFDGVMTSHLTIQEHNSDTPASLSHNFFKDYMSNFKEKILITDDLSDMKSSLEYFESNFYQVNPAVISKEAFNAGNDLLLFSHLTSVSGKQHAKRTSFKSVDISDAITELESEISKSQSQLQRFKRSLEKILTLKIKINNLSNSSSSSYKYYTSEALSGLENINNEEEFLLEVYRNALIEVSKGSEDDLKITKSGNSILFIGQKEFLAPIKYSLRKNFTNHELEKSYSGSKFEKEKTKILKLIKEHEKVFFSASSPDHINILDHIRLKSPIDFKNIVVFLHASPSILKPFFIDRINIIGNFSHDPLSFYIDHEYIDGKINAKNRTETPISISDGAVHNALNVSPPKYEGISPKEIIYFSTELEKLFYEEKIKLEKKVDIKNKEIEKLKIIKKQKNEKETKKESYIKGLLYSSLTISSILLIFIYFKATSRTHKWEFYSKRRLIFSIPKLLKFCLLAMTAGIVFFNQDPDTVMFTGLITFIGGLLVTETMNYFLSRSNTTQ